MIVGFNHNITYRGVGFHVQTEDSGIKSPQLVTLLYHDGTIISSQKTTYADIIKVDNLELVVEELAKEQHKGMLKRLTKGEFDERIAQFGIVLAGAAAAPAPPQKPAEKPIVESPVAPLPDPVPKATAPDIPVAQPVKIVEEPIVDKFRKPKVSNEPSLDELIYAYLTAGQNS